jgi:acyl-CoA dehydrogenase
MTDLTLPLEAALEPPDRRFLASIRAFLDENLDPELRDAVDNERMFFGDHDRSNAWFETLKDCRWHVAHWPTANGGLGWSPLHNYLCLYEQGLRGAPLLRPFGINYVGPTIMEFGSDEQKAELLPRIVAHSEHWCQGFSEPGAGSDLAGVATFAERRGDAYVVNGSKIWTTDAQYADRIFCLLRTSREDGKHALTFMLIDLSSPGVSVQPIRLSAGDHELNQVFFDNVEVLPDCILGGEGGGWRVSKFLLEIERGAFVFGGRIRRRLHRLVARARELKVPARFWDEAIGLDLDLRAYEATELRLGHLGTGEAAAPNIIKVDWTELVQRIDALAVSIGGRSGLYPNTEPGAGLYDERGEIVMPGWFASYFNNRAASIYGGSNEIQRNLIYRSLRPAQSSTA